MHLNIPFTDSKHPPGHDVGKLEPLEQNGLTRPAPPQPQPRDLVPPQPREFPQPQEFMETFAMTWTPFGKIRHFCLDIAYVRARL